MNIYFVLAVIILCLGIWVAGEISLILGVIVGLCSGFFYIHADSLKQKSVDEKRPNYHAQIEKKFQDGGKVLIVKKRNSELGKLITVVEDIRPELTRTPDKYVYTGATVGGITTGGISNVGGHIVKTGMNYCAGYTLEIDDLFWDTSVMFGSYVSATVDGVEVIEEKIPKQFSCYLREPNIIVSRGLKEEEATALKNWLSGKDVN